METYPEDGVQNSRGRVRAGNLTALVLLGAFAVIAGGMWFQRWQFWRLERSRNNRPANVASLPNTPRSQPLAVGTQLPVIQPLTWVGLSKDSAKASTVNKIVVVDIWSDW